MPLMKAPIADGFEIKRVTLNEKGFIYVTFRLTGWLDGVRIRRQFKSYEEAVGERNRLEVQAANTEEEIRAVNTRLSVAQVRAAEIAFDRLGDHSIGGVVDYFLATYRPPLVSETMENAMAEFMRDKKWEMSVPVIVDYRKVMKLLLTAFPTRLLDSITTPELEGIMGGWGHSKKSWNNLRTYLHAFFEYGAHPARRWVTSNPVKAIHKYELARGIPQVTPVGQVVEMFAFLETYAGPVRSGHKPGYLVPYFALATFGGIRPSVRDGEIRKIHEFAEKDRIIDIKVGVIRITPEIAKTNDLRQVTIQPNLKLWLERYPISENPLIVRNAMDHVGLVRKRFALTDDVLRHTFISMYVAKFRSIGDAALEAGNSESMIKKHYLNMVSATDAEKFWSIVPKLQCTLPMEG